MARKPRKTITYAKRPIEDALAAKIAAKEKAIEAEVLSAVTPNLPTESAAPAPELSMKDLKSRMSSLCVKHGYDPVGELLQIIKDSKGALKQELLDIIPEIESADIKMRLLDLAKRIPTPDVRDIISIHREIIQYIAPKLKATDLEGSLDVGITVNVVRFSDADKSS